MKPTSFLKSLLVVFVGLATNCFSQQLFVGGRLGMNISSQSHMVASQTPDFQRQTKIGALVGVAGNLQFSDLLSLQMELLFSQKGSKYQSSTTVGNETMTIRESKTFNYLEIPILGKASFQLGSIGIYGNIGPYVGVALGGKDHLLEPVETKTKLVFGKDFHRRFDFGLAFGTGINYQVGIGTISLDLRYSLGFLDVYYPTSKLSDYKRSCNRTLGISVGYVISLG